MPVKDDELEAALRCALRRESPSPDFAAKLNKRLPVPIWRRPIVWATAAALSMAAILPPAISEYRYRQGAEAHRQLMVALKITNTQLRRAKEKIQHKHVI